MHRIAITYGAFNALALVALLLAALAIASLLTSAQYSDAIAASGLNVLSLLLYLSYFVVGLRFMQWLYDYIQSVQSSDKINTDLNERWAFLGFAIPWVNLVMPYRIIRRLLLVTVEPGATTGDQHIFLIAKVWWVMHLIYFLLLPASLALMYATAPHVFFANQASTVLLVGGLCVAGVSRAARRLVAHLEKQLH